MRTCRTRVGRVHAPRGSWDQIVRQGQRPVEVGQGQRHRLLALGHSLFPRLSRPLFPTLTSLGRPHEPLPHDFHDSNTQHTADPSAAKRAT